MLYIPIALNKKPTFSSRLVTGRYDRHTCTHHRQRPPSPYPSVLNIFEEWKGGGQVHSCLLQRRNCQNKHKHELARISKNYFSCFLYYRQNCESVYAPDGMGVPLASSSPLYMHLNRGLSPDWGHLKLPDYSGLLENSVNLPANSQKTSEHSLRYSRLI